mmetsp:Transcript_45609/g.177510  ORF Transcript_45609/g.177510 Transcript_45609/m.177510 type:complete len:283 (-) Transcript_45609:747-1595(-)
MSEAFVSGLPGCGRVSSRGSVMMCSEKPEGGFSRRRAMELAGGSVLGVVLGGAVQGGVKDAEAMSLKRLKMGPPVEVEDGVVYREIKTGDGYSPNQGDTVAIHYSLFCDGIEVETSRESQGLAARPLAFTWGATRGPGAILKGVPMVVARFKTALALTQKLCISLLKICSFPTLLGHGRHESRWTEDDHPPTRTSVRGKRASAFNPAEFERRICRLASFSEANGLQPERQQYEELCILKPISSHQSQGYRNGSTRFPRTTIQFKKKEAKMKRTKYRTRAEHC